MYKLTNTDTVIKLPTQPINPNDEFYWAEYQAWLGCGNKPLPENTYPNPPPTRDLCTELDNLKSRLEKLEKIMKIK